MERKNLNLVKPTLSFGISSILASTTYHKKLVPNQIEKPGAFSAFRKLRKDTDKVIKAECIEDSEDDNEEVVAPAGECQTTDEFNYDCSPDVKCQKKTLSYLKCQSERCSQTSGWRQAERAELETEEEDKNTQDDDTLKCQPSSSAAAATTTFPIIPNISTQNYLLKSLERFQPKNYGMLCCLFLCMKRKQYLYNYNNKI